MFRRTKCVPNIHKARPGLMHVFAKTGASTENPHLTLLQYILIDLVSLDSSDTIRHRTKKNIW